MTNEEESKATSIEAEIPTIQDVLKSCGPLATNHTGAAVGQLVIAEALLVLARELRLVREYLGTDLRSIQDDLGDIGVSIDHLADVTEGR